MAYQVSINQIENWLAFTTVCSYARGLYIHSKFRYHVGMGEVSVVLIVLGLVRKPEWILKH